MSVKQVSAQQFPEYLRLLGDPSQEVLIERRPAFSQLAPVPLRQLKAQVIAAAEPALRLHQHHQE